ncbi:MAG: metallophosphoesterase [Clostridia bacterium]|nr:metallophosphoesterase [Clostridia bacterium]
MKKNKRLTSLLLALVMIISCASLPAYSAQKTETATLDFATLTDIHFFPSSLTGNNCEAWQEYCATNFKLFRQSESMLRTALETMLIRNPDLKYVLIPGDLTKDGEYEGHVALAEILRQAESDYGIEFIVTNGNHDLSNSDASTFNDGTKKQARSATPEEFREIYAELGFDLAFEEYAEKGDKIPGRLSYAVDFDEGYRLIVIDSNKYFFDGAQKPVTGGAISEELMLWVKDLAEDAYAEGKVPMVMLHHSIAPHMKIEPSVTYAFILDDYVSAGEALASYGIHYAFTGHLHTDDISSLTNDDGETIYDFETASLTSFPCTYRENTISTFSDGESSMKSVSVAFDAAKEYTFEGKAYECSTYAYTVFSTAYGGLTSEDGYADTTDFLMGIVRNALNGILTDINAAGSISAYLKTLDIDLDEIIKGFLEPLIGDGVSVLGYDIFTAQNIMWFIEDLLGQIYDLYVKNPEDLYTLLEGLVNDIVSIKVSDKPCTKFLDEYHFGDETAPGTLGDAVLSVMTYWCLGDEDLSDDEFMKDVIAGFAGGETTKVVFNTLVDKLLHGLIEDELLSKLEIRLDRLLNDDILGKIAGMNLNTGLKVLLKNDFSYMHLVDIVFALEILPYKDLYDILDKELISKYLTDSQFEGTGTYIAYVLSDFSTDTNPVEKGDLNAEYTSEPLEVVATRENYRLPTNISVTMGEDSESEAYISWYSKSTVGGDIEIYKADSEPAFKGEATESTSFTIKTQTEAVTRSYFGIDIGIAGFMPYAFEVNRHVVSLSGLEAGATYYYRVGDAEKGWWSETGKIRTADGSDSVTFIHVADPQSQTEGQYERAWAEVLSEAFDAFPETDFIINTGDLVDHGDNFTQWQYMFNTASGTLMNTYMMPASGNHEDHGTDAIVNQFVLPGMPDQDTASGAYYSFDYNNAHIAVLNTNDLDENEALSASQLQWLKADMNSSDADWKFVMLHKALYSQGSHYKDDDVCAMREQLGSLMPELDIDIVFQGHDHVYMRTGSLIDNEKVAYDKVYLNYDGNVYRTQENPVGTSYVISGTCGVKTYLQNDPSVTDEYFPRGEAVLAVDAPMFSAVRIEDGVLYFDAFTVSDGSVESVDRFAIRKDKTQGDVNETYTEPENEDSEGGFSNFFKSITKIKETFLKVLKIMKNFLAIIFTK